MMHHQIVSRLKTVMAKLEAVGISAPQIGCPLQIMVIEFTSKSLKEMPMEIANAREYQVVPLKVGSIISYINIFPLRDEVIRATEYRA